MNYVRFDGGATGSSPRMMVLGADSTVNFVAYTKGAGSYSFGTRGDVSGKIQFQITDTANAVNNLNVTGAITSNPPVLAAVGSDTNIPIRYQAKGSGWHDFLNVVQVTNNQFPFVALANSTTAEFKNYFTCQRASSGGALAAGDILGGLVMGGHTGSAYTSGGDGGVEFYGEATETWSATSRGTKLYLKVTKNGTAVSTNAVVIDQNLDVSLFGNLIMATTGTGLQLKSSGAGDYCGIANIASSVSTVTISSTAIKTTSLVLTSLYTSNGTSEIKYCSPPTNGSIVVKGTFSNGDKIVWLVINPAP